MSIIRNFTVAHEDGWHSGPYLVMLEPGDEGYFSDSDNEDIPINTFVNVKFSLENNEYHVFHLILYIGWYNIKLLRKFETEEEAENYAKQQYFLATGDYPFVVDEMTFSYDSTGERKKIDITYSKDIKLINKETYEYIIIINDDMVAAHSLNPFAEW